MTMAATLLVVACASPPALAQDVPHGRDHARSMVASERGVVATSQVLASQVGAGILARGGSAADAAIAANLALAVIEPMMDGPGGDLFAIYRDAESGTLAGINASGPAPAGLSIQLLRNLGMTDMPWSGIHSVTVPGAVAGWAELHQRYGRLPWKDLFTPAIRIADEGFVVAEQVATVWQEALVHSCTDDACRDVLLPAGRAPRLGERFRNPGLAGTLKLLAAEGPTAFYEGAIARAILRTSQRLGGTLTARDLATYRPEWVTPISTGYRGWTVYALPPNSRGTTVLEALNILGNLPRPAAIDGGELHQRIEASRLAAADVIHIGDPRQADTAAAGLLAADYARERARLVDPGRARCPAGPGTPALRRGETTFIAVVDRQGNTISLIQSLATGESGVLVEGMGFLLQDRGGYFSLDAGRADALAPGKRPPHTLMPGHMTRGTTQVAFGFVGGPTQPLAQLQFISNVADHGMNLQAALEAPRFSFDPDCVVRVESRIPPEQREALTAKGHRLRVTAAYDDYMGMGQAVMRDAGARVNYGASSPRADGAAVPEPMP